MFIVFEGIDFSGKSTQAKYLYQYLKKQKQRTWLTKEPNNKKIRNILLRSTLDDYLSETLLFMVDRIEHKKMIEDHLRAGYNVICDRYYHSTYAYQCYGRGINYKLVRLLHQCIKPIKPDIVFLLDIDPCKLNDRMIRSLDRMENNSLEFFDNVRRGYIDLMTDVTDNYIVINAELPKEEIQSTIIQELLKFHGK